MATICKETRETGARDDGLLHFDITQQNRSFGLAHRGEFSNREISVHCSQTEKGIADILMQLQIGAHRSFHIPVFWFCVEGHFRNTFAQCHAR